MSRSPREREEAEIRNGKILDRLWAAEAKVEALTQAADTLAKALRNAAGRIEQGIANRMYGDQDASDAQVDQVIAGDPVLMQAGAALSSWDALRKT